MSSADQFVQIGQVLKPNGTDGQVIIRLFDNADSADMEEKPVFIFFDELPVPFFVSGAMEKSASKLSARLTDINSLEDAEEIAGKPLYASKDSLQETAYEDFGGWTLKYRDGGRILTAGKIDGIEPIPSNPCLVVGDALIPLHEDLIVEIDERKKILLMDIPSGLL